MKDVDLTNGTETKSPGVSAAIPECPWDYSSSDVTNKSSAETETKPPTTITAITAGSIFWAVFGALWAFALTSGFFYMCIRMISVHPE
jgi:hypothetical protein